MAYIDFHKGGGILVEKFAEREVSRVVLGANYVWFGLIHLMKPYQQSLRLPFFFGSWDLSQKPFFTFFNNEAYVNTKGGKGHDPISLTLNTYLAIKTYNHSFTNFIPGTR